MTWLHRVARALLCCALLTATSPADSAPSAAKRVAFIVDSWYPWSHADVIGTRLLEGYRIGDRAHSSPVTVASVYAEAPRPTDQTYAMAARYGFRVATSVSDALLVGAQSASPRLAVDGIVIGTREDLPEGGQVPSPTPRLQLMREVFEILDRTGSRVPIFIDKMLAANWQDSQAIVAEASKRGIPLMAGSVLPYVPLDRSVRGGKPEVVVAIASAPYWAFAIHTAELLQGYMEGRGLRETGVRSIREVGGSYWSLPDRQQWGGPLFDALLASAKTHYLTRAAPLEVITSQSSVVLIQYVDGTRAVLALIPRTFDDHEYLLGAQFPDGAVSMGGVVLPGAPFDHFGYLLRALVELFTTGRPCVPVERTLLTTGIVLFGQEARQKGTFVSTPTLAISYPSPRPCP